MTTKTTTLNELSADVTLTFGRGAYLEWHKQDEWQQKSNSWRCTLAYQGRRFSFDFWTGSGIKESPDTVGVLSCLLSDSDAGNMDFSEFCSEMGYDEDSRKDQRTWKACQRISKAMRRLLGVDFVKFLYAERD